MGESSSELGIEALLEHSVWVRGLARRLVADPVAAEDVAQQAWLDALERPPAHGRNPRAWLGSVVRSAARQLGRAEGRRARREREARSPGDAPSADELVDQAEMQREVVTAVLALDEAHRATVLLRYWRGLAPQEIARLQGVPPGTVRSRLHRAHAELRERLDRRFDGDRAAWSTVLLAWSDARDGAPAAGIGAGALAGGAAVMAWKAALAVALVGGLGAAWWGWSASGRSAAGVAATASAAPGARARDASSAGGGAAPLAEVAVEERATSRAALEVADAPQVRGHVRAPDATPLAAAELTLFVRPEGGEWERADRGASDEDGAFVLAAPSDAGVRLLVRAEAEGFAHADQVVEAATDPVELVLPWLGTLVGSVSDAETGAPLAGARIVGSRDRSTTADASGAYRLEGLPTECELFLYARDDGHAESSARVVLHGPGEERLDFRMRGGRPLAVEVLDGESGLPVPDAEVRVDPNVEPFTRTDARGRFTARIVEGERQHLVVTAEGFVPFVWSREVQDAERALAPRIPLAPWAFVEGTVTDERRRPEVGVALHVLYDEPTFGLVRLDAERRRALDLPGHAGHELPMRRELSSGEAGAFSIPVLAGHGALRVRAVRGDGATAASDAVRLAHGRERARVAIVLGAGATVRGRVLFNEEPQAGVEVRWGPSEEEQLGAARTDAAGRYELQHVRPGRVELWLVSQELQRFGPAPRAALEVAAGEAYERDFAWSVELARLSGRVVTESGAPVAGARVDASCRQRGGRGLSRFETESAADGSWGLDVLAGETYDVRAWHVSASLTRADVPAGTADVELVLPDLGKLRIRLVDAETRAPVQSSVDEIGLFWRRSGEVAYRRVYQRLDLDGSGELPLPTGLVDLRVRASRLGYAPAEVLGLPVVAGRAGAPARIELARGVAAALAFVPEVGQDVSALGRHGLWLLEEEQLARLREGSTEVGTAHGDDARSMEYLRLDPGLEDQWIFPDDRGRARVAGLAPGRYVLRVEPDDLVLEPSSFELTGEAAGPLEVRWRAR